tara:strand:- start:365 stop:925 length:561 start_codon:yes stop_codon:yes gene_type:complete
MKKLLLLLIILATYGCNKPKTVLICGDHVCINKAEAEQYFEENLTLEVRVIDNKKSKEINLVEINLEKNSEGEKKVSIFNKKQTDKKLKKLSNIEIKNKKAEIKKRKQIKNKSTKSRKKNQLAKLKKKGKPQDNIVKTKKIISKPSKKITDICVILDKCNIEEISKYLVKQGKEKKFPDITTRESK